MNLHEIGLKHGTDKSTYHHYMNFYERHINKKEVKRFLEIGILRGDSIKTWREWFSSKTIVEGWDISPFSPVVGCDLRYVNQLNEKQMLENVTGTYDIILDDGAHTAKTMQTSMSVLFPYARTYIIEDLHAPWSGEGYMGTGDINTLDLLEGFNVNGWISPYSTDKQKEYINNNMEIVEIFVRGERKNPLSATAIIRNKKLT
jgi:hypothetical protein